MTQMIYKHGSDSEWKGVKYDWKIIKEDDLQEHLDDGWLAHPDELLEPTAEPEQEQKKKPGPKPRKAETNESDNEG